MDSFRHVLVADDDRNDFLLVQLAFQRAALPVRLNHVLDGQQAIDYLLGKHKFQQRAGEPLPDLLLLDLKMPLMDGFDVLSYIRKDSTLKKLPVVVLSASQLEEDIRKALRLGADQFLTKPADFAMLVDLVKALFARWLAHDSATMSAQEKASAQRAHPEGE